MDNNKKIILIVDDDPDMLEIGGITVKHG